MKSLGVVRQIDDLGRIVVPKEMRTRLGMEPKDPVEILVEKDRIVIRKYAPCCIFCGDTENTLQYREKLICKSCLQTLKKAEI